MAISKFQLAVDMLANPRTLFVGPKTYTDREADLLTNRAIDLIALLRMLSVNIEALEPKHIDVLRNFFCQYDSYSITRALAPNTSDAANTAKIWAQFCDNQQTLPKQNYRALFEHMCGKLENILDDVNNTHPAPIQSKNLSDKLDILSAGFTNAQRSHAYYLYVRNNSQSEKRWILGSAVASAVTVILASIFVTRFLPVVTLSLLAYTFLVNAGVRLFALSKAEKFSETQHTKAQTTFRGQIGPIAPKLEPAAKELEQNPSHVLSVQTFSDIYQSPQSSQHSEKDGLLKVESEPTRKGWTEMKVF